MESDFALSKSSIHHNSLSISIKFYTFANKKIIQEIYYNFKYCNYILINDILNSIDWIDLFSGKDLYETYEPFLMKLYAIFSVHIPKTKTNSYKLPWYTRGLKN